MKTKPMRLKDLAKAVEEAINTIGGDALVLSSSYDSDTPTPLCFEAFSCYEERNISTDKKYFVVSAKTDKSISRMLKNLTDKDGEVEFVGSFFSKNDYDEYKD